MKNQKRPKYLLPDPPKKLRSKRIGGRPNGLSRGDDDLIITEDTPLTPFEQKFLTYYIRTGNLVKSIKLASGDFPNLYKVRQSYVETAQKILNQPNVKKELNGIMEELKKETIATAEEVMTYFTKVMRGEINDQFGLEAPLTERTRAAQELARRTVDLDNKMKLEQERENSAIQITLNWAKPENA